MLNIHSESTQEAERSMTRLVGIVEGLVASNADIRTRMDGCEAEQHARTREMHDEGDFELSSLSLSSSAFESDLDTSRVYRKLRPRPSNWSISTSQQGSMALTAFAELTMDDVSNLSIFRLPVWSTDLLNASDYNFNESALAPKRSPVQASHHTFDPDPGHQDTPNSEQDLDVNLGVYQAYTLTEQAERSMVSQSNDDAFIQQNYKLWLHHKASSEPSSARSPHERP